jgi:hypothetical protein
MGPHIMRERTVKEVGKKGVNQSRCAIDYINSFTIKFELDFGMRVAFATGKSTMCSLGK